MANIPPLPRLAAGQLNLDRGSSRFASPNAAQLHYLPSLAAPTVASCAPAEQKVQLQPGLMAVLRLTKVVRVARMPLHVRIMSCKVEPHGRGNVCLELGGPHGADGARRAFEVCGFSGAAAFMNGIWRSYKRSDSRQANHWVRLDVTLPDLSAAEALKHEALGPQHVLAAVHNPVKGGQPWLSHLTVEGGEQGGVELSAEELAAVLQGHPVPRPVVPAPHPPEAANIPAPAAAPPPGAIPLASYMSDQVTHLQYNVEALAVTQQRDSSRLDQHTLLHIKSHKRLQGLESTTQQVQADLATVWRNLQHLAHAQPAAAASAAAAARAPPIGVGGKRRRGDGGGEGGETGSCQAATPSASVAGAASGAITDDQMQQVMSWIQDDSQPPQQQQQHHHAPLPCAAMHAALPPQQKHLAEVAEALLAQLAIVDAVPPAAYVPPEDVVEEHLLRLLSSPGCKSLDQLCRAIQGDMEVTSASGGYQLTRMVMELLQELCRNNLAICEPAPAGSPRFQHFVWRGVVAGVAVPLD
ncbi:hypothetical protein N2152v2_011095 [Parachlorella kessleri]